MVTDDKIFNAALIRYRLGIALIWLGVLTWLPFIVLRIAGEKPSLFWYLPVHLFGVIGGARLRSAARKEMGTDSAKRNPWRVVGHVLIWLGVATWVPYFYMKLAADMPVHVMDYLPFHLTGVLGGILVLGLSYYMDRKSVLKA
ncbi:MAG TPA: hypothetical protein VFR47_02750 [Anaerolineales bacterium]|nr:hypothetical protein [Anaerolineales bacterium]